MNFQCHCSISKSITWTIRHSLRTYDVRLSNSRVCTTVSNCETEIKVDSTSTDNLTDSETPINEIKPTLKPVSLLGLGNPRTARYWRHRLTKERQKKAEEDDYVPSVLKIMYKKSPEIVNKLYPVVSRRLEYINQLSRLEDLPKDDVPLQYPFRKHPENKYLSPLANKDNQEMGHKTVASLTSTFNNLVKHVEESPIKAKTFSQDDNLEDLRRDLWKLNYGTARPNVPASSVPCGGCGAFLHCKDTAIPGFMPSERFIGLNRYKLAKETCQRCMFLQQFNVALNVTVSSEEYPRILSEIKSKIAIVLLMVDLTDFPCSVWPGIIDVIGPKRPIVVVGNKLDLLPQDDHGFLERIKASLKQNLKECGVDMGSNVRYIGLISAKTGYGVEDLITELQNLYKIEGDVYIVGCTNVGKSTLFNALLQSDYCHVQSSDLVQRATTSVWPGTTLNLLKFPILRPTGWRLYERAQRLRREGDSRKEAQLRHHIDTMKDRPPAVSIIGRIGMTFRDDENDPAPFSKLVETKRCFLPDHPNLKYYHCCYDTPGAIYQDQILELLTIEELLKTIPKDMLIPRTFILRPTQTLFLAGLGRVDFLQGLENILVTVFASAHLPVHIVYTEVADVFYQQNLGTSILEVPSGNAERLKDFPPLAGRTVEVVGMWEEQSTADLVLSSAGWVAVTIAREKLCVLKIYTPGGRGCHLRQPPLIPFAVKMRGKRIKRTPAFELNL